MITRVGLYGAGDIADLHAAGIQECKGAQLVGLFDIDNKKSQEKALQYNCKFYDSSESLLGDPAIDAVFVLTPLERIVNVRSVLSAQENMFSLKSRSVLTFVRSKRLRPRHTNRESSVCLYIIICMRIV